ncbi:MAG: bifunctional (p)ppGpp synthetase/guanosine-3',5'-bis(diphosphate) 3'-pyrophosphohydrolase [Clostridiales bacterium]|nr:bifunctional (p)ppGpp synthetase/guanosine-3',5'-bis(diphosphate) 3'-pyrophosphohydrolase [Clostridiales bacterium]
MEEHPVNVNDPWQNGYAKLHDKIAEAFGEDDANTADRACEYAGRAHGSQRRKSGEPYITHPIAVAEILFDLGMDLPSIEAALLHDVVEDTDCDLQEITELFGDEVGKLVDGVTKLGQVRIGDTVPAHSTLFIEQTPEEKQAENLRKMLLAMSEDIRVIIIKLADRLHNMRTLQFKEPARQKVIALETLDIYAPIAHRLGIRGIKEELEDLAIKYLDPVAYREIEEALSDQNRERTIFLGRIEQLISDRIHRDVSAEAEISGRIKSVHGIFRKMYMQNKDFDEIFDIYAVRIIVDTVIDCYNSLGIIHDMFKPLSGRFKDYISTPKLNGYQSLHTTVMGRDGIPFEVQIRTREMHRTAEFGIAAHWKYKRNNTDGKADDSQLNIRLAWIREMLENSRDTADITDIVSNIKNDLVPDEVFVFTPRSKVISLPAGSTVIDFAYAIHSEVGNRMIGAKVDGKIVPINYQIKTGQIVEIITSQQPKGPSRDWLGIVKTGEARSKIKLWFKRECRDENIVEGRGALEREFRRNNIRFDDTATLNEFLSSIAEHFQCQTVEDLYAAIGYGGITLSKLIPRIRDEYAKLKKRESAETLAPAPSQKRTVSSEGVIVEGIDDCLVKLSKCCNPIPGDEIIGFITRGHGVSIHKRDCSNVPASIPLAAEPERWIKAHWNTDIKPNTAGFDATLVIKCSDRLGLLSDITSLLLDMHVMIVSAYTQSKNKEAFLRLTVNVSSADHLKNVISKLSRIKGVTSVERSRG